MQVDEIAQNCGLYDAKRTQLYIAVNGRSLQAGQSRVFVPGELRSNDRYGRIPSYSAQVILV